MTIELTEAEREAALAEALARKIQIGLPNEDGYWNSYEAGQVLGEKFPGQEAGDFVSALHCNPSTGRDRLYAEIRDNGGIDRFVCVVTGENEGQDWRWYLEVGDSVWIVTAGCDYTGWDCASNATVSKTDLEAV